MTSSDDEDLKRAIALSLEADSTPPQSSRNTTSLLGLDRKAQEQERLARVTANKRKASISPPPLYRDTADVGVKRPRLEEPRNTVNAGYYSDLQPKDRLRANNIATAKSIACAESLGSTAAPPTGLQYPSGTVKRTWAFGYERKNDVKIEEVFQKADLKTAVLSAFQWDVEWVLSKIDARTTKLVFAMQAKDKATQDQYLQETAGMPNLRLCFPPMPGQVHCMHSKLMLLFHPGYLRVVVPSANLVNYDWGETGVMENSVFLVDLPRREDRKQYSKEQLTPFGEELIYFLEKMGLQEDVRIGILNFDFSKTQHLAFVHTVGGSHTHEDLKRTGHPGLSRAIRFLDLNNSSNLQVDFVASSLGSLNEAFLQTIYQAACGAEDTLSAPAAGQLDLESSFRIYFPTHETVANSNGGIENGGTICLQSKWYNAATFPRALMRDYKSVRAGLLSHNKILFARGRRLSDLTGEPVGVAWAYVGSANLSESAWGKVTKGRRSTDVPRINCRNWECGVLIAADASNNDGLETCPPMDVFKGYVDVPMEFPGQPYNGRRPWFFMDR